MDWYVWVMKNYANFDGRARRREFWMYYLLFLLFSLLVLLVFGIVSPDVGAAANGLFSLVHLVPSLAVGARRLHDTGRSGWWQLVSLIPVVGPIWLVVLFCLRGQAGPNRFGANPLAADAPDPDPL